MSFSRTFPYPLAVCSAIVLLFSASVSAQSQTRPRSVIDAPQATNTTTTNEANGRARLENGRDHRLRSRRSRAGGDQRRAGRAFEPRAGRADDDGRHRRAPRHPLPDGFRRAEPLRLLRLRVERLPAPRASRSSAARRAPSGTSSSRPTTRTSTSSARSSSSTTSATSASSPTPTASTTPPPAAASSTRPSTNTGRSASRLPPRPAPRPRRRSSRRPVTPTRTTKRPTATHVVGLQRLGIVDSGLTSD